jgi:triosephosphate isomerase
VTVAAQNMHEQPEGAFTGEVSAPMLAELGVSGVVLGHSERREHFGETDNALARKMPAALDAGLQPILCVGETVEEREAGEMQRKLRQQVQPDLAVVSEGRLAEVVIAYEPIWAIGTGRIPTLDDVAAMHATIRKELADMIGDAAEGIRILYGGSMNGDNAADLLAIDNVDGGLVGGASLSHDKFVPIIEAAASLA